MRPIQISILVVLLAVSFPKISNAYIASVSVLFNKETGKYAILLGDIHGCGTTDENNSQRDLVMKLIFDPLEASRTRARILVEDRFNYLFDCDDESTICDRFSKNSKQAFVKQVRYIDPFSDQPYLTQSHFRGSIAPDWFMSFIGFLRGKETQYSSLSVKSVDPRFPVFSFDPNKHNLYSLRTLGESDPELKECQSQGGTPLCDALKEIDQIIEEGFHLFLGAAFKDLFKRDPYFYKTASNSSLRTTGSVTERTLYGVSKLFMQYPHVLGRAVDKVALWELGKESSERISFLIAGQAHTTFVSSYLESIGYQKVFETKSLSEQFQKTSEMQKVDSSGQSYRSVRSLEVFDEPSGRPVLPMTQEIQEEMKRGFAEVQSILGLLTD
jgi:hypothetical protein